MGTNVLALSVHNDRAASSDVWFSMSDLVTLTAEQTRPKPTRVILTPTDDPYTSQNVTFQGARATDTTGRVEIRPVKGGDLKSVRAVLQPGSISTVYRVLVTAGTKQVVSGATVLVDATRTPVFATDLPPVVKATSGEDVRLSVALSAETPAALQWQRKQGSSWVDVTGRTGATLSLETVRTGAQYRVVATAGERTASSGVATVQVNRKAASVKVGKVVARKGRTVTVRIRPSADGVATVKVVNGGKAMRTTLKVKAGRAITAKLGKLSGKAKGHAAVTVAVATGIDHDDARSTARVRVTK